jgi:hypothetical protein
LRVAYFVQSHRQPEQVFRLLTRLREGSPQAVLLVGHCPTAAALDGGRLRALGALDFRHRHSGRRGYWSLLEPYFTAVELLAGRGEAYDWLVYLSGADYPLQPLARSEAELAASAYDGYMTWSPISEPFEDGRRRQGTVRYGYRYRDYPRARPLLRVVRKLNGVQPWFQVHLTYGPRLGVRRRRVPALAGRTVYRGSQWTTLRRDCAERVLAVTRDEPELLRYFESTVCPDEAFVQTVLLADRSLRFCNDNRRWIARIIGRDGHPDTLRLADGPALADSGRHFGRKVDPEVDAALLDYLDARLDRHGLAPDGPPDAHPRLF